MEKHCEPCKSEGIQRMSTMFCGECKELYCSSCGRKHKTYRICQTHNVVQLEDSQMSLLKATMESISFETVDSDENDKPHLQKQGDVGHKESKNIISKTSNYDDLSFKSDKEEENAYKALENYYDEISFDSSEEEENTRKALGSTGENVKKEKSSAVHSDTQIIYAVDLIQSPTQSKLRIPPGCYQLRLHEDGITLLDKNTNRHVSYWPFPGIRRFGSGRNTFTVVAGRRCESGEGEFVFKTSLGTDIQKTCVRLLKLQTDFKTK